jgi:fructose-specific phosphotransferase system IIA component
MIDLHTVLEKECVLVDPAVSDKESLLRALVGALAARGSVSDAERLFADVMAREKLAPTGLGEGCAVPHANSHAAAKSAVAVARLGKPMDFGAADGQGSTIVVLMAGPPESMGSHLQIISKIARVLHDPTFMAAAIAAKDSSELAEAFYSRGA